MHAERFRRLVELGVHQFQVSFDGPREVHDRRRIRVGGQATFDRIWTHLEAARRVEATFTVYVRLHPDEENLASIPKFLEDYRTTFGDDPRFELFVRRLSRFQGSDCGAIRFLARERAGPAVQEIRDRARQLGLPLADIAAGESICSAASANSFVVRADGTLGKCSLALDHPKNNVGRLLEDGRVELDDESMKGWMRGLFSGDRSERSCPMRGFADG